MDHKNRPARTGAWVKEILTFDNEEVTHSQWFYTANPEYYYSCEDYIFLETPPQFQTIGG